MIAGIDIGTSYSSICVLDGSGKIKPVDIATGTSMFGSKYSLPSAVFVEDYGNVLVGQAAMNSRKRRPQNFRMEFKRDLGQDIPIVLGNTSFLPEDFYTELFRHMKASVGKMSSESIETVCLTCPAAFGKKKREKVLKAAKAAGFFNVQLVDEPTAAAMSFKDDGILSGRKKLLIYDFGGGTFDVSLLAYDNGHFSLMTEPSGLERCGGIDIDRMIFEDMQKCIDPEILASIAKDPKKAMRLNVQLSELAVKAKHHLSTASVYEEYIEVGMDDFEYTLTLDKLNTMIAGMVGQTIDVCRKVVEDAGIKVKDLSAILMVGGTSRVPLVQTMVKQMAAGVPVYCSADVDLAVARGALMFARSGEKLENGSKAGSSVGDRQERKAAGNEDREAKKTETASKQQLEQWFELGKKYDFGEWVPVDYKEAVKWYCKAAEGGHTKAQNNLGHCYFEGKGVAKDTREAVKWYRKAAESGNAEAQCNLGVCYDLGIGVEKNTLEAEKWYKKAAAQGNLQSRKELDKRIVAQYFADKKNQQKHQEAKLSGREAEKKISKQQLEKWFELGKKYDFGEWIPVDYKEAVKWYRKAAEGGHAKAQNNLGVCYIEGKGVAKDEREAVKWFTKSAEQGFSEAQYRLGICYYHGQGIPKDTSEAVKWFRKAADGGHVMAQYSLGVCYAQGAGVARNPAESEKWYKKAAARGNLQAQKELDKQIVAQHFADKKGLQKPQGERISGEEAEKEISEGQLEEWFKLGTRFAFGRGVPLDYKEAAKWYRKAAERGHSAAQFNLGVLYERGIGTDKNNEYAFQWYLRSAMNHNPKGQLAVGLCYLRGIGTKADYLEACTWLYEAAKQGDAEAQTRLGICYAEGSGVKKDVIKAAQWYQKAAAQGNHDAQMRLGKCYETGEGVPQNFEKAKYWYVQAKNPNLVTH